MNILYDLLALLVTMLAAIIASLWPYYIIIHLSIIIEHSLKCLMCYSHKKGLTWGKNIRSAGNVGMVWQTNDLIISN